MNLSTLFGCREHNNNNNTKKMGEENRKQVARTDLGILTVHNINQLKLLNSLLFPVEYRQPFYDDLMKKPELTKLGLFLFVLFSLFLFSLFFSLLFLVEYRQPFNDDLMKKPELTKLGLFLFSYFVFFVSFFVSLSSFSC